MVNSTHVARKLLRAAASRLGAKLVLLCLVLAVGALIGVLVTVSLTFFGFGVDQLMWLCVGCYAVSMAGYMIMKRQAPSSSERPNLGQKADPAARRRVRLTQDD